MSSAESQRYQDVSIGHRCTSTTHRHYTRKHVEILVQHEVLVWVGQHHKIASWIREVHWENHNGSMQLLPGNASKKGARQGCAQMPQLSQFKRGKRPLGWLNDGRVE